LLEFVTEAAGGEPVVERGFNHVPEPYPQPDPLPPSERFPADRPRGVPTIDARQRPRHLSQQVALR
jgi:hypothetical protein